MPLVDVILKKTILASPDQELLDLSRTLVEVGLGQAILSSFDNELFVLFLPSL